METPGQGVTDGDSWPGSDRWRLLARDQHKYNETVLWLHYPESYWVGSSTKL